MANLGVMTFPGLNQIISGSMTFSHGISPSSAVIQIAPQAGLPTLFGTLRILFGGVVIEFPDSVVDTASLSLNGRGQIWSLRIKDRRWKWQFGVINGWYNRRLPDGTVDTNLEKTPQQLAELLLEAMGETTIDVTQLPNDSRPEVNWIADNPANELAALCDSLGCRVVLTLSNGIGIGRIGTGADLPLSLDAVNQGFSIDPKEIPDKIELIGAPTLVQSRLKLEAVGKDTDGSIKPIAELSYIPTNGWEKELPHSFGGVSDAENRKLALQTVFRWYRVKEQVDGTKNVPGLVDENGDAIAAEVWQLQFRDVMNEAYTDSVTGENKEKPAELRGIYYPGDTDFTNTAATAKIDESSGRGWQFNVDEQIVEFSSPVYKLADTTLESNAADLVLETSYAVLEKDSRQPFRYRRERDLGGEQNTGIQPIRHDEVVRTIRQTYNADNTLDELIDSESTAEQQADQFIDASLVQYQTQSAADVEYAGIKPIDLDGAIQQVSWVVGGSGARTRASRNMEHDLRLPNHRRRRDTENQRFAQPVVNAFARRLAQRLIGRIVGRA